MTGQQLQGAIQAANAAVSGMTCAEAAAAMGSAGSAQGTNGFTQIFTFPMTSQTGGQSVSLEAQYAAQMWNYWQTVAGAEGTTVLGAAAGAAVSWASGALIGTGEGLAATAGILTLSVPTAVAMLVPVLGVGLGYALYETNPQLWNKISDSVMKFASKGTETIRALIDAAGNVLLPKDIFDEVRNILAEEGMKIEKKATSSLIPNGAYIPIASNPQCTYSGTPNRENYSWFLGYVGGPFGLFRAVENSLIGVLAASSHVSDDVYTIRLISDAHKELSVTVDNSPYVLELANSYTYNNLTAYWNYLGVGVNNTIEGITTQIDESAPIFDSSIDYGKIAWTMLYGTLSDVQNIPDGFSLWDNPDWVDAWNSPLDPLRVVDAYDPSTGDFTPYYPVTPFIGDEPGTSVDPATTPHPDPTTPLSPIEWPIIEPYIDPVVNPDEIPDELPDPDPDALVDPVAENDPIYIPVPDLNPEVDPVVIPDVEPAWDLPSNIDPPFSGGETPPIVFPVPDVPFPSIVPAGSDTPVVSGQAGFIQVYNPTPSEFVAFGRWLWVTYADATIDKIWNNPFDGVIGAHELYATPSKDGYSTIRSGFLDSGISSIIVRQRYTQINCGSIVIPEFWSNYLDYSPYSRAYIYLPFIGIVDLDVDDIVGHAINVLYHIDSYNGSCIAQITVAKTGYTNTVYQFSGNCAVEIPMSGGSQAAIKAAMMTADAYQNAANVSANASLYGGIGSGLASAAGGVLTGLGTGSIGAAVGGIASGVGSAISGYASAVSQRAYGEAQHTANMLSGKSIVQHSGSFGSSYGAMGIKKPFIIIRRPIQKVVNNYNKLYGYPAHKQVVVGNCQGFLRCREVHVVSSLATDAEKSIIENLLTTGVYVTDDYS